MNAPVEEDGQLLHQVREDPVQVQGEEERDVALAPVLDAVALGAPARDEIVRDVGSSVLNDPVFSSASSSVANLASCEQFLVQKSSMSLTEQVLLHRDAQLLGMQVISEEQRVKMLAPTSTSSRPGQLGGEFQKLFTCKQSPIFTVPCVSSMVQKPLVASPVCLISSTSTTAVSTTSVPVSSLVSKVPSCQPASTSSSRTSILISTSSSPSLVSSNVTFP